MTWRPYAVTLSCWASACSHYKSHRTPLSCQKRATTLRSSPPPPPEPAPEPWACCDPWSTCIWWRPELKLAHSRVVGSQGASETSGPAPSRDSVPKQTKQRPAEGRLQQLALVILCLNSFTHESGCYLLCSDPRSWQSCHGRMLLLELCHQAAWAGTCNRLWFGGGLCTPQLYSQADAGPRAGNTQTQLRQ